MGQRRIRSYGFEDALVIHLADNFRFQDKLIGYSLKLNPGRNLFIEDMPEIEELQTDAEKAGWADWDEKEPVLSIYTETGGGVSPTVSSGSRMEWILRFVLRRKTVAADVKELLEYLYDYFLTSVPGRVVGGTHQIKTVVSVSRPVASSVSGSDLAYGTAILRFLVVAM